MTLQHSFEKTAPAGDVGTLADWLKALGLLAGIAALAAWIGWGTPTPTSTPAFTMAAPARNAANAAAAGPR
jgi:hypothetical protein